MGLQLGCLDSYRYRSMRLGFLYRLFLPFVRPSSTVAKQKSILFVPGLLPEPFAVAAMYGIPRDSRAKYPLYLLEPFRWLARVARAILRG